MMSVVSKTCCQKTKCTLMVNQKCVMNIALINICVTAKFGNSTPVLPKRVSKETFFSSELPASSACQCKVVLFCFTLQVHYFYF